MTRFYYHFKNSFKFCVVCAWNEITTFGRIHFILFKSILAFHAFYSKVLYSFWINDWIKKKTRIGLGLGFKFHSLDSVYLHPCWHSQEDELLVYVTCYRLSRLKLVKVYFQFCNFHWCRKCHRAFMMLNSWQILDLAAPCAKTWNSAFRIQIVIKRFVNHTIN